MAVSFVEQAESELELLDRHETRAYFSHFTDETPDHAALLAEASEIATARRVALAKAAAKFDATTVPDGVARKLGRIKLAMTLPSPADPVRSGRLAELISEITGNYTSSANCVNRSSCRSKQELYDVLHDSRDPEALAEAWTAWRANGRAIRQPYAELVEIANEGARQLGYADVGALWRSHYDLSPEEFFAEYERLWNQVRPLYEALHCHARTELRETYGTLVPQDGTVPAHLLGHMWAYSWAGIDSLIGPGGSARSVDVTSLLIEKDFNPPDMVHTAEAFFGSLGLAELPASFWERSMFAQPEDRNVNCHATSYGIDLPDGDTRMTMCVRVQEQDFLTIHHELGHIYYYLAYADHPFLFRDGANPAFHEAIGDAIALSITPKYLQAIGLLEQAPDDSADLPYLFRTALDKIPTLASNFVVDMWRWQVFSGEIPPDGYNDGWWRVQRSYQGLSPPVPRAKDDFDAGMIYQVSFNVPDDRYFIASILQFHIHRALCEEAGHEGPLHRCSIFGSRTAGDRLAGALALGASQPWPDALETLTGSRTIDASAVVDYFAPVMDWLDEQNQGRKCGWQ